MVRAEIMQDAPRPGRTTLLGEHVGRDYEELAEKHGKVRLWRHGHHIAVFESSGVTNKGHAELIIDYHKRHIEAFPRPFYSFGNWSHLQGYTPDVRRMLTDWQMEMAYDALHISHCSQLIAMSVAVANAVMPTIVQVHATEELLDDALLLVRRRHGV
jgi:hypothetical protein